MFIKNTINREAELLVNGGSVDDKRQRPYKFCLLEGQSRDACVECADTQVKC